MRYRFSILIAILFISCQKSPVVKSVELNQEFSLKAGDTGIIKDLQGSLKVVSINDSRCPEGVQCIWAGSADVIIAIESESTGAVNDTLRSYDKPVITLADFSISLIEVAPYPKVKGQVKDKEARLFITQD